MYNSFFCRYEFTKENLPAILLVPNQFGFGLKFYCRTWDELENRLEIACAPSDGTIGTTIHCFQSRLRTRERRSRNPSSFSPRYNSFYINPRDDSNSLQSGGLNPPVAYAGAGAGVSTETAVTTTAATTEAPAPPPPTSKLPDLRGILRNAKPFVGSCIGASTGCSVCVVVLGRLPLGALPAACTGPCFVTTFANCGALLGRVFAETTVVCTELFRQGLLDLDTFLVDAEFGNQLRNESPLVLSVCLFSNEIF